MIDIKVNEMTNEYVRFMLENGKEPSVIYVPNKLWERTMEHPGVEDGKYRGVLLKKYDLDKYIVR